MKKIDSETNRERVRASREKSDIIYVTLPKGTKEKMEKLTNERLVAYARRMILNDLDRREEEQKEKNTL